MGKRESIRLLIIGKIPPPIGGVTVHVKRLLESLSNDKSLNFCYINTNDFKITQLLKELWNSKIVHVHLSNPFILLSIIVVLRLSFKKSIFTYHGDVGRFSYLINLLEVISIKIANYPIFVNLESYQKSCYLNKNSQIITPFIPPMFTKKLNPELSISIKEKKTEHKFIFCTNAYNISYDKHGVEIYQILSLVKIFNNIPHLLLIVSDPTGANKRNLQENNVALNNNILIIDEEHDFNSIIDLADCVIRYTSTDGDSLSIKEALYKSKNVIASNVVSRPAGTILVNFNLSELQHAIINFVPYQQNIIVENGFVQIKHLYQTIIDEINGS